MAFPMMIAMKKAQDDKKEKEEEAALQQQNAAKNKMGTAGVGGDMEAQKVTTGNKSNAGKKMGKAFGGKIGEAVVGFMDAKRERANERVADAFSVHNKKRSSMQKAQGNLTGLMSSLKPIG